MSESPLDELFAKFPLIKVPAGSTLELEARYSIDERKKESSRVKRWSPHETITIAKNIITRLADKKCTVEQTINFIKQADARNAQHIKQVKFINGEQQKDLQLHYMKVPIMKPILFLYNATENNPQFKLTASFEKTIDSFDLAQCSKARIKLRYSIELGVWRLDITLIKNLETLINTADIKHAKTTMLYKLSVDEFVAKAPWDKADSIEFEMEFIGKRTELNMAAMVQVADLIKDYTAGDTTDDTTDDTIPNDYQAAIFAIAKYLVPKKANLFRSKFGMKQLSNQVIELDKNTYLRDLVAGITNYYITDKVDGKRTIVYVEAGQVYFVNDTLEKKTTAVPSVYIFDCELYESAVYIFDVMVFDGKSLVDLPFSDRLKYFAKSVALFDFMKEKQFIKLTENYRKQITDLKAVDKPYHTDGIILTPGDGRYCTMQVYKYKPIDKLSIDFLIKKCPQKLLGIKPYMAAPGQTLYLLFCGINRFVFKKLNLNLVKYYSDVFPAINMRNPPDYFPIQFDPSNRGYAYCFTSEDSNLDGQVGEFRYRDGWELMKIRADRMVEVQRGNYFGNNYRIAEATWLSYGNPLVIENIKDSSVYFQVHESELHKASRNFNRYAVSQNFETFKGTPTVMDLASGKGQDLFRYANFNMGQTAALFVEIDATALMELTARKHDFANNKSIAASMKVFTQNLDLNASYKTNIGHITDSQLELPVGFDLVMCNFAMHYFLESDSSITNITKFISHYLKPGGRFCFTAFDGEAVAQLLKEHAGQWDSAIPNKFSIKKEYSGDALQTSGQKISVMLPFTAGGYYSEWLVNIDYLEKKFEAAGMTLEINKSFAEYHAGYGRNKLDADDILYTGLYHTYIFYKTKTGGRRK